MKFPLLVTAAVAALTLSATAGLRAQQMDPSMTNMPEIAGMQHDAAKPADAHGVGIVKAVDTASGTITLQHEAITAIGWPAMTMAFKVASPTVLKRVKIGDKVRFGVHPAGMASTVTSITSMPK